MKKTAPHINMEDRSPTTSLGNMDRGMPREVLYQRFLSITKRAFTITKNRSK
jgi:hypothetical protein